MDISVITPVRARNETEVAWLNECIASVFGQSLNRSRWEMIVVNDHSGVDLSQVAERWPGVRWLDAEGSGVSAARNQAAQAAQASLLYALDADDKLGRVALERFLKAWSVDDGILYSDVMFFGRDWARAYLAEEYDFRKLLHATFMTIGCLHKKEDWARVGGWREDMKRGLEDWEYWIALGEVGVCGRRIPGPLYWYRRHGAGRLSWLRANIELWEAAYLRMRELHMDVYQGRYPEMCCGQAAIQSPSKQAQARAATAASIPASNLEQVLYVGNRAGSFSLVGPVTRTQYNIPGTGGLVEILTNGKPGVRREDVKWFLSIRGGRDYQRVDPPARAQPATVTPNREPVPVVGPGEAEGWVMDEPDVEIYTGDGISEHEASMAGRVLHQFQEEKADDVAHQLGEIESHDAADYYEAVSDLPFDMNITTMTVAEIQGSNWPAEWIPALLQQERETKNRKTVIAHLERLQKK